MDIITAQAVLPLTYQIKDIDCRSMWQPFWWRCFFALFSRKFMIIAPESAMCSRMQSDADIERSGANVDIILVEQKIRLNGLNFGHFLLNRFEIFNWLKFCHCIRENRGLVCRCPLQIRFAFESYPHISTRGNDNGIEIDVGVRKKRLGCWLNVIILPHTRTLQKIVSAYFCTATKALKFLQRIRHLNWIGFFFSFILKDVLRASAHI